MDADIIILQDLSWHTLQQRRLIQPLVANLKNKRLLYRWTYPFGLQVTRDGTTVTLSSPEDIPQSCQSCGIKEPDLSEWIKLTLSPKIPELPQREDWTEVESPKSKKKKNKMTPEKRKGRDE
ncbi:hypothetical protein XELAEV_18014781mg [Xenopus laevis]|uniref:Uncharacterized protein n=1 Tax=Xenopus laevis TaxID=8355 RepID=A0A974DGT4_XENLA|nr:hypothetical protein XELAEV_18014781mg [Xenopus laevis]